MTGDGVVPRNWPFFEPLPDIKACPSDRHEMTNEEVAGYASDFIHGQVTRCERCGRTEGLGQPRVHSVFTTTRCDCNYIHIRPTERYLKGRTP